MALPRRLLLPVAAIAIPLVAAVAAAEIAVRLLLDPVPPPKERAADQLQYAPSIFARHVLALWQHTVREWGHSIRINDLGYRGADFAPDKPTGLTRIMIYGGSTVFDTSNAEDWPHRVQVRLHDAGYAGVEIINAGIPGHASFDALGRLMAEGHRFSPDYVLLSAGWNDIKYFRESRSLLRAYRPWIPTADPRTNYMNDADEFLGERSQLYLRLREAWYVWKLDIGPEGQKPGKELADAYLPDGPRQFRIIIETFVDLVRNIGAVPVLVTEARLPAAGNSEQDRRRIAYDYVGLTHEGLLAAYAELDGIVFEVAAGKDVAVIDASALMTGGSEYFLDQAHLTEAGSIELARILADALPRLLSAAAPAN